MEKFQKFFLGTHDLNNFEKIDFKVQIDKWENTFFLKIFLFCYQKKVLKNYLSKKTIKQQSRLQW